MSYPQDTDGMDQSGSGGPIRRARERALAGEPREDFATFAQRMAQPPQSQPVSQQYQKQQSLTQTTQRIPIPSSARKDIANGPVTGPASPPSIPVASRIPISKPQGVSLQTRDGQIGVAISRPTPAPQWPLAGSLAASYDSNANGNDVEPYRPPPGRSQVPQRPPRPSRVPSILDSSKIHDQMPTVFTYNTVNQSTAAGVDSGLQPPATMMNTSRESDVSLAQQSSASSASRPSTISSVGSIPDFPVPVVVPVSIPVPPPVAALPLPRRSVNLGPPPSARRGASSFYSNASYVSPIPEESPKSRSHASFASSAAMPDNWESSSSLALSPSYPDAPTFYEDIPEENRESTNGSNYDEDGGSRSGAGSADDDGDGDEKNLVRSASIGKRAKAALVTTSPFREGTGYVDASSSSSAITAPTNKATIGSSLTVDSIIDAYDAAASMDPANPNRRASLSHQQRLSSSNFDNMDFGDHSRPYNRLSAIRRPPRLDIEAVRKAEARGSLTSLPDLIRRATRLAASLERGKRPASRIDNLDMSPGMYGRDIGKTSEGETDKYRSGLSDMLAAFPPPGQPPNRRSFRQSLREQVGSWPLAINIHNIRNSRLGGRDEDAETSSELTDLKNQRQRKGRRCCGLPLWGFVLLVIAILIIVAAAIVIPVEFFVVRKQSSNSSASLPQCQSQLTCANGGTNIVSAQGFCSCICTNDFTGFDCTVAGDNGCTTTSLASSSGTSNLTDVTLGTAIPRLLEQAQQNFSIPLSGMEILAVFNSGNLSCAAENALVTFDGESVRQSSNGETEISAFDVKNDASSDIENVSVVNGVAIVTVTVEAEASSFAITKNKRATAFSTVAPSGQAFSTLSGTTLTVSTQITPSIVSPTSTTTVTTTITPTRSSSGGSNNGGLGTTTSTESSATPTVTFTVTENVLDFARVAVLLILQQESLASAESAQSALQRFFSNATTSAEKNESVADVARNISLTNGNSINLINFQVNAGNVLRGANISS